MTVEQTYQDKLENHLDRWKGEIRKFRVIAEVADKDAQIEHYRIIDAITERMDRFADRLEQIKGNPVSLEQSMKDEFETMRAAIDEAIESARKKIN